MALRLQKYNTLKIIFDSKLSKILMRARLIINKKSYKQIKITAQM